MTTHEEFLELAAARIDFPLDAPDERALEAHLAACTACRRRVFALDLDARRLQAMPPFTLAPERAQEIWQAIDRPRRRPAPSLRLVWIAALLGLLAIGALGVGASLERRPQLSDAATPTPREARTATPSGSLPPSPAPHSPAPQSPAPQSPAPAVFARQTIVEILVPDLRVRTEPTVDDAVSVKLEPLLGTGTRLEILDGPVLADDYEWYLVQAIGWPHRGWVAAADHDGEPWIEDPAVGSGSVAFSEIEEDLVASLHADAALGCAPRTAGLPAGAIAGVECRVNTALVARVGAYRFETEAAATTAYLERLGSVGVTRGSGDCRAGRPGDAAWSTSGELVSYAGAEWAAGRIGCFLDQYGAANLRVTCGRTFVGILGRDDDLAALSEWVRFGTQPVPGTPPGICASPE